MSSIINEQTCGCLIAITLLMSISTILEHHKVTIGLKNFKPTDLTKPKNAVHGLNCYWNSFSLL